MRCLFYRKNDTVQVHLKRDSYLIVQLQVGKKESNYAIKRGNLYHLVGDEWEKIVTKDLHETCETVVKRLVDSGWTVWIYQQEMLEKLIYDWHEGSKAEWLFFEDVKTVKRIELYHKNVLMIFRDGEYWNFSFPNKELKTFSDYRQISNKPLIEIRDGLRVPVADV